MANNRQKVEFMLTKEQFDVIHSLFGHYNWDIDESLINKPSWEICEDTVQHGVQCVANEVEFDNDIVIAGVNAEIIPTTSSNGSDNPFESDNQSEEDTCPYCFCCPCVTTFPQSWLGGGATAHDRNSGLRKIRYKKFWTLLSRQNAWANPRYLDKKKRYLGRSEEMGIVWTKREIMPECVLTKVRHLYPNPRNIPYMGHKWV